MPPEKKPTAVMLALIHEADCIGCTKCIEACPVDAILGSAKYMHTVIASECIGCYLCVPPCPVDCIEMIASPDIQKHSADEQSKKTIARIRIQARKKRLTQSNEIKQFSELDLLNKNLTEKKNYIKAAILRAKAKKNIRIV